MFIGHPVFKNIYRSQIVLSVLFHLSLLQQCRRKRKWIGGTNLAVLKAKPINLIILQTSLKKIPQRRAPGGKETEAKNSAYVVAFMTTENVSSMSYLLL